jgi:hypothetical protein
VRCLGVPEEHLDFAPGLLFTKQQLLSPGPSGKDADVVGQPCDVGSTIPLHVRKEKKYRRRDLDQRVGVEVM